MKRFISGWLIAVIALIAAAPAFSQQQGRGGRGMGGGFGALLGLAHQQSVQTDLKMTDEQAKSVDALAAKNREAISGLSNEDRREKMQAMNAANDKALAEALTADQMKRLKQIALQAQGVGAIQRPEVAEALALTAEQKEEIQAIGGDLRSEMRDIFADEDREAAAKKMSAARKAATEKMLGVFTDPQKAKWSELTGEPFTGELAPGPGMGGRRGGGNRPADAGAGRRGRPGNDT